MSELRPFHLAFPVSSIEKAEEFYSGVMKLEKGRATNTWIDYNFYGHQVVFHLGEVDNPPLRNLVDNKKIEVPHFGVILKKHDWTKLIETFRNHHVEFIIEPYLRFEGKEGEQGTFFVRDYNGLCLEFKTFQEDSYIFKS